MTAADDTESTEIVRVATNDRGEPIQVMPLDHLDNPYAGRYEAWDLWVWENYDPGFNRDKIKYERRGEGFIYLDPAGKPMPDGWGWDSLTVDEQGFPVPAVVEFANRWPDRTGQTVRELLAGFSETISRKEKPKLYGTGIRPDGLQKARTAALEMSSAAQYPPIPAWLGENLPLRVVFSPNGDILCYGELGLHYDELCKNIWQMPYMTYPETWYRYSPEGELLGTGNVGSSDTNRHQSGSWTCVYCPERNRIIEEAITELTGVHDRSRISTHYGGWFTALLLMPEDYNVYAPGTYDRSQAEIAGVWDMFGNEIDPDEPVPGVGSHTGSEYRREYFEKVYAAQVELGLTDPAVASPFAGMENGPQSVDPTPRFPRLAAHDMWSYNDVVEVRPVDDPANPYRGEYEEWDHWMLSQLGSQNPREQQFYMEQHEEMQKKMSEKVESGEEITDEDYISGSYRKPADDPWTDYTIYVTHEGWIVPARRCAELKAAAYTVPRDVVERRHEPRVTKYSLNSGGVMPDEMLTGYRAAILPQEDVGLPPVPQWLAENPVHYLLFIPNGDIVTLGPLGFRTAENADTPLEGLWTDTPRAFHRYSADGELLGTYETKGWDWQALYYPQWNALKANAQDSGMQARDNSGYLIISEPGGETVTAVFDYDGTPVNPQGPVLRRYYYCRALRWESIEELIPVPVRGEPVRLSDVARDTETFSISVE